MDVIEPSEIITGEEQPKTKSLHINPWMRLSARFFDYALFFSLLRIGTGTIISVTPWIPIEFFAWIPIEALLLGFIGTTPGKWLLKIEVEKNHRKRLGFETALRRSFSVWLRGLGLGIPFLNFFCMLSAYHRLKAFSVTSWDRDEKITVSHHPVAKWRFYTVSVLAIIGMIFYSYWKRTF